MKKIFIKIVLFVCLFIPVTFEVNAEGITNYFIDAKIEENGDLYVKELFTLDGSYNGFERIINYKGYNTKNSLYNGSNVEIINVKGIESNGEFESINFDGDTFNLVSSADKGDYGVYTVENTYLGKNILIYNPNRKNRSFYIEYRIKNIAILHNDIGELYWNVFDSLTEDIDELLIKVHLENNQNLLKVWGHGPLNAEIWPINTTLIEVKSNKIFSNSPLDIRLAFDREIINKSTKINSSNALNGIIEDETKLANEANEKREYLKGLYLENAKEAVDVAIKYPTRENYENAIDKIYYVADLSDRQELSNKLIPVLEKIEKIENVINIVFIVLVIIWMIFIIFRIRKLYMEHDKEYETLFKGDYYRDFPAEYGPSTVGYLIRRSINNDDLSASILNLINKKVIAFETLDEKGKDFKFRKLETNYQYTTSDEKLMKFLFNTQDEITLYDIKKRAKDKYQNFINDYSAWKDIATKEAMNEEFFESKTKVKVINGLFVLIGALFPIILILIGNMYYANGIVNALSLLVGVIVFGLIVYIISFTKKTRKGIDHYKKWIALKKFMNDFGNFSEKELPEITLWEKYLVYAVTLGVASKLAKTMKIKIEEFQANGNVYEPSVLEQLYYMNRITTFNNVMASSINSAITSAYTEKSRVEASSSSSSGGGFGGGFSGGGGFGGGGGGGGRF